MSAPFPGSEVDGDAHVKIVTGFRDPQDAWRSMGNVGRGMEVRLLTVALRHAHRKARREHRETLLRDYMRFTRSIEAWGSRESASVAAMRVAGPKNVLDQLLQPATPNMSDTGDKP